MLTGTVGWGGVRAEGRKGPGRWSGREGGRRKQRRRDGTEGAGEGEEGDRGQRKLGGDSERAQQASKGRWE